MRYKETTLKDVAEGAGVNISTASFVINGMAEAHRVSIKTSARIMRSAQELGYEPNPDAVSLRREGKDGVKLADVVRAAGFSSATVSNILNGHERFGSASTRQKVHEVASKLGYSADSRARRLRTTLG